MTAEQLEHLQTRGTRGARGPTIVRRLARVTISLAILTFVLRNAGADPFRQLASQARFEFLPPLLLLFLTAQALYANALKRLVEAMGGVVGFRAVLANHYKGLFWASFLPSTMGGDVYRVIDLGRIIRSNTLALTAIAAQRVLAMGLALALTSIALPLLTDWRPTTSVPIPSVPALLAGLLLLLLSWAVLYRFRQPLLARAHGLRPVFRSLPRSGQLNPVLCFLLAAQWLVIAGVFLLARALAIEVPVWHYAYIVPLVQLATAIPISVNGIGIREGAYSALLGLHGVPAAQATGLGLLLTGLSLIYALIGGGIFALSKARQEESRP